MDKLSKLINNLSRLSDVMDPKQVGPIIQEYLPKILTSDDLLDIANLSIDETQPYTKHNLHVNEDGQKWSIQALLWPPNAKTDIHNHKCWCTFGIYKGQMVEETFDENVNIISEKNLSVGDYASLIPNGKDIHRMVNKSSEFAISIHFYGINGNKQSSVLKIY